MQREACVSRQGWDKFHCTPFLSDIPQPISWAHPSWMTIASWFAYQKRFPIRAFPARCERLENIDNYWQNPKARATFHLEYCIYRFILLFAPFFLLMRARYWLEYLIAAAEAYEQSWGGVGLLWKWLWMGGYVVIACLCTFPNDTDFN